MAIPLVQIIVTLVIVGVVLYLIDLVPMDGTIRQVIKILVILLSILWVLALIFPGALPGTVKIGVAALGRARA